METKFTKGEWILNNNSCTIIFENDCSRDGEIDIIAHCEEAIANAKLVAAAPDMYNALEHIIEYWNRDRNDEAMHDALWHIIETAEKALEKATK
jgi:hypothetical protein